MAYGSNPVLRTPAGTGTFGGIFPPSMTRTWQDDDLDFVPDCELTTPGAQGTQTAPGGVADGIDFCGPVSNTNFASTQLIGATFDPDLLSGWGKRPSDWSLGISVQQELFPRASVEVAYHRRWFTMYTTGGSVTDNLAIGPSDVASFTLTEPSDPRLPGGGGQTIGPLYNTNPNVFGQLNQRIVPTNKIGDDTRMFNGVDVTFNLRNAKGITFSGGTSTGKVENDWCDIRAAVPENFLLNPYCNVSSPWLTSVRGLVTYTIPRIDVQVSSVIQDKPNVGTDQIGSIAANYTMTAADQAAAAAQIGRPLTAAGAFTVNLAPQGEVYGHAHPAVGHLGEEDPSLRRAAGDAGLRHLQPHQRQRVAGLQPDVRAGRRRLAERDVVHEPARLPSERASSPSRPVRPESVIGRTPAVIFRAAPRSA